MFFFSSSSHNIDHALVHHANPIFYSYEKLGYQLTTKKSLSRARRVYKKVDCGLSRVLRGWYSFK